MRQVLVFMLACVCWPFAWFGMGLHAVALALVRACAGLARWVLAHWSEILSYLAVGMIGTGAGLEWGLPYGLMVAGGLAYLEYLIGCALVAARSGRGAK